MNTELILGGFTLAAVLTALQGVVYGSVPIPDKHKPLASACLGTGLGLLAMVGSVPPPFEVATVLTYSVGGFMVAATSSGIFSWVKNRKKEISVQKKEE